MLKSSLPGFMCHICHHLDNTVYTVLLMSFHSWLLACIGMAVAGIATVSVSPMDKVTGNIAPKYSILFCDCIRVNECKTWPYRPQVVH